MIDALGSASDDVPFRQGASITFTKHKDNFRYCNTIFSCTLCLKSKTCLASADLDAHVLHSDVVPLGRFTISAGLVAGLVLLQPVSDGLGRLHHVLQLVWVRRWVALQVSLLVGEKDKREGSQEVLHKNVPT